MKIILITFELKLMEGLVKMYSEEILKLIGNISPHGRDYVGKAIEDNSVEILYIVNTEQNKGVYLVINNDKFCYFYASFINESNIKPALEIIKNTTKKYISKVNSKEICFNVYGKNIEIVSLVREMGFISDMEGYHLQYIGEELPELKNCNLVVKGFESSMIKEFVDLFDTSYYQLNIDNGWNINGYAVNEEGFQRKLNYLKELGQVASFWLNDELVGAYVIEQNNYISDFVVKPRFQNKGYGSYILAHCIRNMREDKAIENLRLRVTKSNISAKRLYERYNFIVVACFAEHTYGV
ncbi:MAG: N-acetyltransferase [Clostridiales bacterium]|jgi:ribosomal protein S18 acetylase RimI-like enzyme|nr:N-acetyltransferase [Clostridiales bacterium]